MRGASEEIANTTIECNSTMLGNFIVTSDLTTYGFHIWRNSTIGRVSYQNSTFLVDTTATSSGNFGGGDDDDDEEEKITQSMCQSYEDAFVEWLEETKDKTIFERINSGWRILITLPLCKSYASVYPPYEVTA